VAVSLTLGVIEKGGGLKARNVKEAFNGKDDATG